jgi:hypothetical protein
MADLDKVADSEDPRLAMLREIVKSFMLRRTKAALVHSKALVLPPLSEVTMWVLVHPNFTLNVPLALCSHTYNFWKVGAALWLETCHLLIYLLVVDRFSPMANLQKHVYVSVLKKESPKLVGDGSGATTSLQNIVSGWASWILYESYIIEIFCCITPHSTVGLFSYNRIWIV